MRTWHGLGLLVLALLLAGCAGGSADKQGSADRHGEEAEIQAALARLGPEDRKLAEGQKFCAVEEENRLGSMGTPVKLMVRDQPVFLCCKGCREEALAHPDKTLAKVKDLKAAGSSAK